MTTNKKSFEHKYNEFRKELKPIIANDEELEQLTFHPEKKHQKIQAIKSHMDRFKPGFAAPSSHKRYWQENSDENELLEETEFDKATLNRIIDHKKKLAEFVQAIYQFKKDSLKPPTNHQQQRKPFGSKKSSQH